MLNLSSASAQSSASLVLSVLQPQAVTPEQVTRARAVVVLPPIGDGTRLMLLGVILSGIAAEVASAIPDPAARLGVLAVLALMVVAWPRA